MTKAQTRDNIDYMVNQFEVFLRDDFLPLYLKPNYETIIHTGPLTESTRPTVDGQTTG